MRALAAILLLVAGMACGACSSSAESPAADRAGSGSPPSPAAPPAGQPPPATPGQQPASPPPGGPAAAAPPASAPDPALWYPRYEWSLEVDGKPAEEARFFTDIEGKKVLVLDPRLASAGVMAISDKHVATLDSKQVTLDPASDTARIAPQASLGPPSPYTVEGAQVVFYLGGNRLKITPKQHLEGPATLEAILNHSPLYRRGMREYVPGPADVAFLRSVRQPVEIVVFFGTWCPHCKVLVPKFMKTMQEVDNPAIQVSYMGVPRNIGQYDPARARGVTGVPSFLFYRGGREIDRIPGEPADMTIEAAVAQILRQAGA